MAAKRPSYSVIVPAWKAETLSETIESICRQTVRPHEVLIGVDCCADTLALARDLQEQYARKPGRRARNAPRPISIRVLWFPVNVGPYRVRNACACLATGSALMFFDADDLMDPGYASTMLGCLEPGRIVYPAGRLVDCIVEAAHPDKWQQCHGIPVVHRQDFIAHGGFRPWRCAADTEARHRLLRGGLALAQVDIPICTIRKLPTGLTRNDDTGHGTPKRQVYRQAVRQLQLRPERIDAVSIAAVFEVPRRLEFDPASVPTNSLPTSGPIDEPIAQQHDEREREQSPTITIAASEIDRLRLALEGARRALRQMCAIHPRGFTERERRAYDLAQKLAEGK